MHKTQRGSLQEEPSDMLAKNIMRHLTLAESAVVEVGANSASDENSEPSSRFLLR